MKINDFTIFRVFVPLVVADLHTFSKPSHDSNTQLSTSASSSGYYSNQSDRSDPSPPSLSHLSESAPARSGLVFGPFLQDEGLELEEEGKENVESPEKKVRGSSGKQFTLLKKLVSASFFVRFNFQSTVKSLKDCENVVKVSASHSDPSCLRLQLWLRSAG